MMRETITQTLCMVEFNIEDGRASLGLEQATPPQEQTNESRMDPALMGTGAPQEARPMTGAQPVTGQTVKAPAFDQNDPNTWIRTPRNAPCPCGSGKKYKQCHGKIGAAV